MWTERSTEIIGGVQTLDLKRHADMRGELIAFELGENLPFSCRRVFTIRVEQARLDRGGHANSCDELVVALAGSVAVRVHNGRERGEVRLASPTQAIWIKSGVMISLRDFESGTLLLVCASKTYAETEHFHQPQPHLWAEPSLV